MTLMSFMKKTNLNTYLYPDRFIYFRIDLIKLFFREKGFGETPDF